MKTTLTKIALISALVVSYSMTTFAATKSYSFSYKGQKEPITVTAESRDAAYKIAAKMCFNKLTGGTYPGEEQGLDYIDICANPKM